MLVPSGTCFKLVWLVAEMHMFQIGLACRRKAAPCCRQCWPNAMMRALRSAMQCVYCYCAPVRGGAACDKPHRTANV